ncbi:MAG: tRNA preQ1(34) S-adenosylmethionine ribosyltransferase-isomerase QueA [Chloroflexota bacterium]
MDLSTADFDYHLPAELIAQDPSPRRDHSRLMVVDRRGGRITHSRFSEIGAFLTRGDALVANRSKVLPARLRASRATGGSVELLLIRQVAPLAWAALIRPSRRLKPGETLGLDDGSIEATVEKSGDGQWLVRFEGTGDVASRLRKIGRLPLPPYIHRSEAPDERYQTVYADRDGSIAAPTAGLHFTPELLSELDRGGVKTHFLTLHVGIGTFLPVKSERVADHRMHSEWGEMSAELAADLNQVRGSGHRLVAIGTTTVRVLESAAVDGELRGFEGETDRFIVPGYQFQAVDALITNFHLPRSTLLMLVSALAGTDLVKRAYQEAIRQRYRFYSFGDAMLIL